MSRQTIGQAGVRVYVPDADGDAGYHPRHEVVSQVRAHDRGPDVLVEIYVRGIRAGALNLPARDEALLRRRLFADPPTEDREAIGALIQELEDAAAAHEIEAVRQVRRRLMAYVDELRATLAERAPAVRPA